MQLKKILEEMEQYRRRAVENGDFNVAAAHEKDMNIIRKHMNDGWIPVEQRLPEKDGFYIATIDGEIIGEDDPFVGLAEFDRGDWYDNEDYTRVIAWRPLPDPYRPERSTE